MKLSEFDFDLPQALIATRPVSPRSSARLLVADTQQIKDCFIPDLVTLLRKGDLLVLNNTKVIPARLQGVRLRAEQQAKIELTLLEPIGNGVWSVLAKPLRKLRAGDRLIFKAGLVGVVVSCGKQRANVHLEAGKEGIDAALEAAGEMPLPPYISAKRPADMQDKIDYQTVFAKKSGAVAAPTASLHFDEPLLERIKAHGVEMIEVTLHVGAGTFLPVKVDEISDHKIHAEWGEVTPQAAQKIAETRKHGGRVIPVGTTVLRLIETAAQSGQILPFRGSTDIFITPGYEFQVTDGLMTNFHLPKSTLMMLVSALMGVDRVREIYAHAIARQYRFFSYGDASLLFPSRVRTGGM